MAIHTSNLEKKIAVIKELFCGRTSEEKIQHLMKLGRDLPPYADEMKIPACQESGCQSTLYLTSRLDNNQLFFAASSDALISAGLAALLIAVYNGETPETILKTAPDYLQEIGVFGSLTASRSNGLAHIHQRMKKDALKFLLSTIKPMEVNSPVR